MKKYFSYSVFIVVLTLILIISGCIKDLLTSANRDQYVGNWAFKVYNFRTDIFGTKLDSVFYYGTISKGNGEKEILIQYTGTLNTTQSVESDGKISLNGVANNNVSGGFDGSDLLDLGFFQRTNSYSSGTTIHGAKQIKSSVLDQAPTVITNSPSNLLASGGILNGTLKANFLFTNVSFEYGITTSYGNSIKAIQGTLSGNSDTDVSASISGLSSETQYHFRVKASNSKGISFGDDITFTTVKTPGPISDIDGNTYKTTTIGTQSWMAENLRVTRYADGTPLQLVNNQDSWNSVSEISKTYCFYNDDPGTAITYGALYKWAAAMNGAAASSVTPSGVQGICPDGWHLPSESEWSTLEIFLGGTVSGSKMLATEFGGTNESGFSAILTGRRSTYPYSFIDGSRAYFWTTSLWPVYSAINVRMVMAGYFSNAFLYRTDGLSVRCVKN